MRRLFEQAKQQIGEFIEQRDDLVLILGCSDNDVAIGLKILRDIEQANGTDVFLLFADNFIQPGPFVSVAVERLKEEHRMACEALREEGKPPLPDPPAELSDEKLPPAQRLQRAVEFAGSLLPRGGGNRLIWAMFPLEIGNRHEYLKLAAGLFPMRGIQPWMRGVRLLFRDLPGTEQFIPGIRRAPRVRLSLLDFSPKAAEESLDDDARDESLPEDQRMQSLLMAASLDYAHNRTSDALSKYELLLGYFQKTGNLSMQALVINAQGDIHHRAGDLAQAQHWYECALAPSGEAKDAMMLAIVGRNLGDVSFKQHRFADAEQYYDGVDKLAGASLDAENKIRALEWRGLSQEKQSAWDRAAVSWEAAALLSRNIGIPGFLQQNLRHLERAYQRLGDGTKLAAVREEMHAIPWEGAGS